MVFVHAPSFVEMLCLCFFFSQRFVVQDANRPAGCHHCSLQLWDDVSASPLRSVCLAFVMFVLMFNNYVHGDYPYMPHSKWANISETGLQSVSGTGDFRSFTMPNLKIVQRGCEFSLWNKVISIFVYHTLLARMLYMPVLKLYIKCMEVLEYSVSQSLITKLFPH